jgi:hypothetical protein
MVRSRCSPFFFATDVPLLQVLNFTKLPKKIPPGSKRKSEKFLRTLFPIIRVCEFFSRPSFRDNHAFDSFCIGARFRLRATSQGARKSFARSDYYCDDACRRNLHNQVKEILQLRCRGGHSARCERSCRIHTKFAWFMIWLRTCVNTPSRCQRKIFDP